MEQSEVECCGVEQSEVECCEVGHRALQVYLRLWQKSDPEMLLIPGSLFFQKCDIPRGARPSHLAPHGKKVVPECVTFLDHFLPEPRVQGCGLGLSGRSEAAWSVVKSDSTGE